jgi:flagellar motor protein MotB
LADCGLDTTQKRGTQPNRLVAMGFGSMRPVVPENPAAAANRRVEVKVLRNQVAKALLDRKQ